MSPPGIEPAIIGFLARLAIETVEYLFKTLAVQWSDS